MLETQKIQIAGMAMFATLLFATVAFAEDVGAPDVTVDPVEVEAQLPTECGEIIEPVLVIDPPPLPVICEGGDDAGCGEWVEGNEGEGPISVEDGETPIFDGEEPEILYTTQTLGNEGAPVLTPEKVAKRNSGSSDWFCEFLPNSALCLAK